MKTTKILFLHGFFASGSCIPAQALKQAFKGKAEVLTPDLPLHPREALVFITEICEHEQPIVLVGNSNGSFLGQIVASRLRIPALLGNPHFEMTRFLSERIGTHEYKSPRTDRRQHFVIDQPLIDEFADKSPRADGRQHFVIDQPLIDEFADIQAQQWDDWRPEMTDRIWGLFGVNDYLAHFEPLFLQHYTHAYHFPGAHTPTAKEVREYYVPLIEKLYTTIL